MKILAYSKNRLVLATWQTLEDVTIIQKEIEELYDEDLKDVLILLHYNFKKESEEEFLTICEDLCKKTSVCLLSDLPRFEEGKKFLQKGIKAYGNSRMHSLVLKQLVEVVTSGNVWLYPEFMSSIIADIAFVEEKKSFDLSLLSTREQDVAKLVAKGRTNKQISLELGISASTVKAHMSAIFEKTKTKDRLSLALLLK